MNATIIGLFICYRMYMRKLLNDTLPWFLCNFGKPAMINCITCISCFKLAELRFISSPIIVVYTYIYWIFFFLRENYLVHQQSYCSVLDTVTSNLEN